MGKKRNAQVSMEYLIIMGFVTTMIIIILGIALTYTGSIQDNIKVTQVNNFANKVISSAESVFYYGEPSKSTISAYLPEGVKEIQIVNEITESENAMFITISTSTGLNKIGFSSEVPINGTLTISPGIKRIEISADDEKANIGLVV